MALSFLHGFGVLFASYAFTARISMRKEDPTTLFASATGPQKYELQSG